jgi:aminoglycoside phosphotransferase (APT) family kinase protein
VDGLDEARVSAWLGEHVGDVDLPLTWELAAGGRSNLTFVATDRSRRRIVVRRPPTGQVLATAHDVVREARVLRALAGSGVPVPGVLGLCEDREVTGAPFLVMDFVDGHVLRDPAQAEAVLDPPARARASAALVRALVDLHRLDPRAVGLADLGPAGGYVTRQLRRWARQVQASLDLSGRDGTALGTLHDRLAARLPMDGPTTIVHGDFRLDNAVLGDDGTLRAILDWELCTLGDPRADLGLLLVYWAEPGDPAGPALGTSATLAEGFWSRAEVLRAYRDHFGEQVADIEAFVAFGYWKLACILEGVYSRYQAGAGGGDRSDWRLLPEEIDHLLRSAEELLDERSAAQP